MGKRKDFSHKKTFRASTIGVKILKIYLMMGHRDYLSWPTLSRWGTGGVSVRAAGPGLASYQTEGDTAQLDHVRVGYAVEAADPCVEDGDQSRDDHGGVKGDHEDYGKGRP